MPVSLHRQVEEKPVSLQDWLEENYPTILVVLFILQVIGLYWIGTTLAYAGV